MGYPQDVTIASRLPCVVAQTHSVGMGTAPIWMRAFLLCVRRHLSPAARTRSRTAVAPPYWESFHAFALSCFGALHTSLAEPAASLPLAGEWQWSLVVFRATVCSRSW